MRTSTIALFAASMATVFTLGCRGDDSDDGDADADADTDTDTDADQPDGETADGDVSGEVTIFQVQGTEVPDGASIQLNDVIVTAIDTYGMRTGTFFVQDPAGGEFSGVLVFGASPADVAGLTPGDRVRIEGAKKQEFTGPTSGPFQDGQSTTEVVPESTGSMTVTVLESGTVPAPALVDAAAIGALPDFMDRNAEWEKWEGVLIKVENVNALGITECVGSACPDDTNTTTDITGDIDIQTSLAPLPSNVALGDCFASVTGVVDYFYDYHIYNTSADAVVTGGTDCELVNEAASVVEIQTGAVTGLVTLTNVFVTGRDEAGGSQGIFVADSLTAAQNNGVLVYTGSMAPPANIAVGAKVNVTGTVVEFDINPAAGDTLTELTNAAITFVEAPAAAPTPATSATAAQLSDIGPTGEVWEGVLVRLSTVKVTNNSLGFGQLQLTDNTGATIVLDDDSFFHTAQGGTPPAVGTCYATLTGNMSVQLNSDIRTINPRSAADMMVGTGCN